MFNMQSGEFKGVLETYASQAMKKWKEECGDWSTNGAGFEVGLGKDAIIVEDGFTLLVSGLRKGVWTVVLVLHPMLHKEHLVEKSGVSFYRRDFRSIGVSMRALAHRMEVNKTY